MMTRFFAFVAIALCLITSPLQAQQESFVRYAAAQAEYSLLMPEAPSVTTIWANSTLPGTYAVTPPADLSAIGENALYRRVDSDTGDEMTIKVMTLQATEASLTALTQENVTSLLEKHVSGLSLEKQQTSFSGGSKTLKWGTLTGYEMGKDQRLIFHSVHYLSGLQSVTLAHISFSLENRRFKNDYETIGRSIKYTGR